MGNTYTVTTWQELFGYFQEVQYWQGESLIAAIWNMFKAKREYPNCVKFEWR